MSRVRIMSPRPSVNTYPLRWVFFYIVFGPPVRTREGACLTRRLGETGVSPKKADAAAQIFHKKSSQSCRLKVFAKDNLVVLKSFVNFKIHPICTKTPETVVENHSLYNALNLRYNFATLAKIFRTVPYARQSYPKGKTGYL